MHARALLLSCPDLRFCHVGVDMPHDRECEINVLVRPSPEIQDHKVIVLCNHPTHVFFFTVFDILGHVTRTPRARVACDHIMHDVLQLSITTLLKLTTCITMCNKNKE